MAALGIMAPFVLHINSLEKKGVRGLFPLRTVLAARGPTWHSGSTQAPSLSVLPGVQSGECEREPDILQGVWAEPGTLSPGQEETKGS